MIDDLLPIVEGRTEILAVYLFGSAARTAAAPRDLDLAVILRDLDRCRRRSPPRRS